MSAGAQEGLRCDFARCRHFIPPHFRGHTAPYGNLIAPGASAAFTAYTPPAILANVPEASGCRLICKLAIPGATLALSGNQVPTFSSYAFATQKNTAALISRASLLAKASDLYGDTLAITGVSAALAPGGSVSLGASAVSYTPAAGFLGAESFTITIDDGRGGSVVGTVNAAVTTAAISPAAQSSMAIRADGKVDVLFSGTPGQSYQIQRSIDLGNPLGWTTLLTVTAGDDGLIPFTDAVPPAGDAFYRTITTPP